MSRSRRGQDAGRRAVTDYVLRDANRLTYAWVQTGADFLLGVADMCGAVFLNATDFLLNNSGSCDDPPCQRISRRGRYDDDACSPVEEPARPIRETSAGRARRGLTRSRLAGSRRDR